MHTGVSTDKKKVEDGILELITMYEEKYSVTVEKIYYIKMLGPDSKSLPDYEVKRTCELTVKVN